MKLIGYYRYLDYKKVNFTKQNKFYDIVKVRESNKQAYSYLNTLKKG